MGASDRNSVDATEDGRELTERLERKVNRVTREARQWLSSSHPRRNTANTKVRSSPRMLWLAVIVLAAALVAETAGVLAYAGGSNMPTSILTAGGAFAGCIALLLALVNAGRESR